MSRICLPQAKHGGTAPWGAGEIGSGSRVWGMGEYQTDGIRFAIRQRRQMSNGRLADVGKGRAMPARARYSMLGRSVSKALAGHGAAQPADPPQPATAGCAATRLTGGKPPKTNRRR